ncbi:unnamed protein product [Arctia plantaginis]|uniref:RNA helicase n=1 Tax=Arctia plantaginis TaxID=874455 RepID=A0A8S0ZRP4_ARCPL|nr:unnamed protein product [Arctia plantaginis]
MAMGLVVKSRLEEYWNVAQDIFITPGFAMEMTCDRFQLLSKCLHFRNNNDCDPALLTRPEAKIYKIKPILDHLNNKFSSLYNLSKNIALDESLTMWKGWLDINQFIRNKAATVGIKTYEICESQTGYLWRFEVHAGHDDSALQDDDPISGIVPSLVLGLLNGLEHKGHTIWMDNFYNSPALARELKVLGFDCVGTLRTNRQFVPRELATITKRDMTVGQVLGCTSGDVDLMVWRDKNRVAFISTYHGLAVTRCGDTLKPTVVQDYNVCMGGVDRKDQQLAMYPIERRRTRVCYIVVPADKRLMVLFTFLKKNRKKKVMVFFSTCMSVKYHNELFNYIDLPVMSIHGKQQQTKRTTTFFQFCNAETGILLCTDVAARGLDIPAVDWIVQYDPPDDPKEYIHRVGRTARGLGTSGQALLFLRPEELGFLRYLKQSRVALNDYEISWNKVANIQQQLEKLISKNYYLNQSAKEAFKSYLRAYDSHHLKTIFDIDTIDMAQVSKSFGFVVPPAIELKVANKGPPQKRKGGGGYGYYKSLNAPSNFKNKADKTKIYRQKGNNKKSFS